MKSNKGRKKRENKKQGRHQYPLPGETSQEQKRTNANAYQQAEKDIANDAELVAHNKNDDLDEGETARLGDDNTDLV